MCIRFSVLHLTETAEETANSIPLKFCKLDKVRFATIKTKVKESVKNAINTWCNEDKNFEDCCPSSGKR